VCRRLLNSPRRVHETETWWELRKAFSLWSNVSSLTFREVGHSQPADIDVSFVTGYHSDGAPFDGEGKRHHAMHCGTFEN